MGYEFSELTLLNNPELQFLNYQPKFYNSVPFSQGIVPQGGFVNYAGFSSVGNAGSLKEDTSGQNSYQQEIQNSFARMDSQANGGNGDGKVSVDEALNDLDIPSLFSNLDENSDEYKNLKKYTDKVPAALAKYAGNDKEFTTDEWDKFLNGSEWLNVIDTYHKTSSFAKDEMSWIDAKYTEDSNVTTTEVVAYLYSHFASQKQDTNEDFSVLKTITNLIYKYAGSDSKFTKEEYTQMLNDSTYSAFVKKYYKIGHVRRHDINA